MQPTLTALDIKTKNTTEILITIRITYFFLIGYNMNNLYVEVPHNWAVLVAEHRIHLHTKDVQTIFTNREK